MNITRKVVSTLTYSASTDQEIDLPTEGVITRIDLEVYDTQSSTLIAITSSTQALWRILNTLRIQGGSGRNYFSLGLAQSGIMLHYMNLIDFPGTVWHNVIATSQYHGYRLHFGSKPRDEYGRDNPFDLTAGIPADEETNLKLIWGCPANTVRDTATTISSATMRVTVHYVIGANKAGMMIPVSTSEQYNPTTTKADLGGERDIPTGGFVRRIIIMALDNLAYGSNGPILRDDQVTEIGVILNKDNRRLLVMRSKVDELAQPKYDGQQLIQYLNTPYSYTTPGLYSVDLRQYGESKDFGIDTRNLGTGELVLGLTIGAYTSGDIEHIWYDVLVPYGQ